MAADACSIQEPEIPISPRTVFVVMAVHAPNARFLHEQLNSILIQSNPSLKLIVALDGHDTSAETEIRSFRDPRIVVVPSPRPLEVLRAFELGLETALRHSRSEHDLFAFADQDDVWERDKVARLSSELDTTDSTVAFSDAVIVDGSDAVVARSLFLAENRLRNPTLANLLVSNSVSGMAMLLQ
jgi:hypothetical protein